MAALRIKSKQEKVTGIFGKYNFAEIYNRLLFFVFQNKHCRVIVLGMLLAILLMAYYYVTSEVFMSRSTQSSLYEVMNILHAERPATSEKTRQPQAETKSYIPANGSSRTPPKASPPSNTSSHSEPTSDINPTSDTDCRMFSCFNYTRCPLKGSFLVYLYDLGTLRNGTHGVTASIREILAVNNYITSDPEKACLFIVIVDSYVQKSRKGRKKSHKSHNFINEATLSTLPYWGRYGQNHVLLNLGYGEFTRNSGSAIKAQAIFTHKLFRPGFDVIMPITKGPRNIIPMKRDAWTLSVPMSLARRRILVSFQSQLTSDMTSQNIKHDKFETVLNDIKNVGIHDIHFGCKMADDLTYQNGKGPEIEIDDWALCSGSESRIATLLESTFALILAPKDYTYASTHLLQTRLYEALESGAVPVILGGDRIRLPFEEVLDWRRAVISLPAARVSDLKFLLESMADEDILAFRRNGRMLWERYLSSVQASVDSLLAIIRTRLNMAPQLAKIESTSTFVFSFPKVYHGNKLPEMESNTYKRNFTVGLLNGYEQWNLWGDPFALYPQLPWDPILTPEARYLNNSAAKQFQDACEPLGGDRPMEQYTVVILTYKRNTMLNKLIMQISQLPYLNKILVICNGPRKPDRKAWPTTVPIVVVHASRNSLNNRFVPHEAIETEAVLSLDDDIVYLKKKEIRFAFKVWRQHRDQIVGFVGRNFVWDAGNKHKAFLYPDTTQNVSATACQIGLVLTGAAFIHRYYLWAYWRVLPRAIRTHVDDVMNCEDIAMNFLVSHISRKPPIKVDSKWGEYPVNPAYYRLSRLSSHYAERSECMKYFAKVLGYTPLLSTHYIVKPLPGIPKATFEDIPKTFENYTTKQN